MCILSHFSHVQLFATPWTVAHQAPLSIGFSRQEYWSGLSCPLPGDLPDPGIELMSSSLQTNCSLLIYWGSPNNYYLSLITVTLNSQPMSSFPHLVGTDAIRSAYPSFRPHHTVLTVSKHARIKVQHLLVSLIILQGIL